MARSGREHLGAHATNLSANILEKRDRLHNRCPGCGAFCAENSLSAGVTFKIRLVLEELVQNLIDHAKGSLTDRIDVTIDLEPGRVILALEDDSALFDPRGAPAFDKTKPLEERGPRGMGIHLVQSVAERIAYERVGDCNRLTVQIAR